MNYKVSPWKSIQFKFLVGVIVSTFFVIGVLIAFTENRKSHIYEIYTEREVALQDSFSAISGLESQSLESLTIENTYWNDMVSYITTKDKTFEEEVLRPQLTSYAADAIWTYDKNYKLATNINTLPPELSYFDLGLNQTDLKSMFVKDYIIHFYKQTKIGFVEVYGATVHPTIDVDRKTPPQGYFFITRILDKEYIDKLESATDFEISLISKLDKPEADWNRTNPDTGIIAFTHDLKDEEGKVSGKFDVRYFSQALVDTYSSLEKIFVGSVIFLAVVSLLFYKTLKRIIIDPLAKIYRALLTDDLSEIDQLKLSDSEVGRVAELIDMAIRQKNEIAENADRIRKAQQILETRTKEIETINNLMIDRELKMIELKAEIKRLKSK